MEGTELSSEVVSLIRLFRPGAIGAFWWHQIKDMEEGNVFVCLFVCFAYFPSLSQTNPILLLL